MKRKPLFPVDGPLGIFIDSLCKHECLPSVKLNIFCFIYVTKYEIVIFKGFHLNAFYLPYTLHIYKAYKVLCKYNISL